MRLTAVCISDKEHEEDLPFPFYCHTEGYNPAFRGHEPFSWERWQYLTDRYNAAVKNSLRMYPETEFLFIIDSYYLNNRSEIVQLVQNYKGDMILGASIWYWSKLRILPAIRYYDTVSVNEFRDWKWKWYSVESLPTGIIPVSGVGGCWILPRDVWEDSNGFFIPEKDPQAGGSKCLRTGKLKIRLDCDVRLWRTAETNPAIMGYPWPKRIRVSLGEHRNRVLERIHLGSLAEKLGNKRTRTPVSS